VAAAVARAGDLDGGGILPCNAPPFLPACLLEHSNSGEKSFRFDSIGQSDKFAACTLIFK